jgi:hypothetical protein
MEVRTIAMNRNILLAMMILLALSTMAWAVRTTTPGRDVLPDNPRPPMPDARILLIEVQSHPAVSPVVAHGAWSASRPVPDAIPRMHDELQAMLLGPAGVLEQLPQPGETGQFIELLTGPHVPLPAFRAPLVTNRARTGVPSLPLSLLPPSSPASWHLRSDQRLALGLENDVEQLGYATPEPANAAIPTVPVSGTILLGALGTTLISWLHRRRML